MSVNRRDFLKTSLQTGLLASAVLTGCVPVTRMQKNGEYDYTLTVEPADFEIRPGTTTPGLGFNGEYPYAPLKAKQGKPITIRVVNKLQQPTTIHWHGIRLDIKMDGVPFLSQKPIMPGETFVYHFNPPDAGTFWFHPHVNSVEQLGKGLVGLLIVEEADNEQFSPDEYAADLPLMLKNWHLNKDGSFKALTTPRNAARMGTPGNYPTVNGVNKPAIDVPAEGWLRLRFANVDNTVVYKLRVKDYPAYIISIDANPLAEPKPLDTYSIGAGMRVDIAIKAPPAGEEIIIENGKGKRSYRELLRLKTVAEPLNHPVAETAPLPPLNPLSEPDLASAEIKRFTFEWEGAVTPADSKGKAMPRFWAINRIPWTGMSADNIPAPLATLELGKTYIFDLKNATPHRHPIHIHGVMFKVIRSNQKKIDPFFTDTVLMERNEQVQIAFVADNPGRWMYHCHVIEHMKTGLMGYITIA
ncbi:multicopper oxidase family protein [Aliamphritea spongicola]|uniref:multicopper oxidase family protein n=1 Tax=Aliamphritea spongicola TaxID=707589 RepID=UPI001FAEBC95|nr:multicopper oxidase family protein [Aliamphritea spongicola]